MHKRFDRIAATAIKLAGEIARTHEQECVGTEHVLLAVARVGGRGAALMVDHGLDEQQVKKEINSLIRESFEQTWVFGQLPGTPHFKNVVAHAIEEARNLGAARIGTEHLILALLREKGCAAQAMLGRTGMTLDGVRQELAAPPD